MFQLKNKIKAYYKLPEIKNVIRTSLVFIIFLIISIIYIWTLRNELSEESYSHLVDNENNKNIIDSLKEVEVELNLKNQLLEEEIAQLKQEYLKSIDKIKKIETNLIEQRKYYINEKRVINENNNTDSQLEYFSRLFLDNRRLFGKLYSEE